MNAPPYGLSEAGVKRNTRTSIDFGVLGPTSNSTDPVHCWAHLNFITEAMENSIDSNLHSLHFFLHCCTFKGDAAANVCRLLRPLRYDLRNTRTKLDTWRKCI